MKTGEHFASAGLASAVPRLSYRMAVALIRPGSPALLGSPAPGGRSQLGTCPGAGRDGDRRIRLLALLLLAITGVALLCLLGGCGGPRRSASAGSYVAPGALDDPWGPYIREASGRFAVPEAWIRAVMHQESGGHEFLHGRPTTSDAGAMGLMQLMPATYAELQDRYGLGPDPYDPHDNIMAGTAYIREMYERYGAPGFLAAYNAGPQRVENYLEGRTELPNETINYLAAIAPKLGNEVAMTGPLAVYARSEDISPADSAEGSATGDVDVAAVVAAVPGLDLSSGTRIGAGGCDLNAAYDPAKPCQPPAGGATAVPVLAAAPPAPIAASPPPMSPAAMPAAVQSAATGCYHDPNAAFDPDAPCMPPPQPASLALPAPEAAAVGAAPEAGTEPATSYAPPAYAAPAVSAEALGAAQPPGGSFLGSARATPGSYLWGGAAPPAPPLAPPPRWAAPARPISPRFAAAGSGGSWGVQVGAYADPADARAAAETARRISPLLVSARTMLGATAPFGGRVLYRARLVGLSPAAAAAACGALAERRLPCMAIAPGG